MPGARNARTRLHRKPPGILSGEQRGHEGATQKRNAEEGRELRFGRSKRSTQDLPGPAGDLRREKRTTIFWTAGRAGALRHDQLDLHLAITRAWIWMPEPWRGNEQPVFARRTQPGKTKRKSQRRTPEGVHKR